MVVDALGPPALGGSATTRTSATLVPYWHEIQQCVRLGPAPPEPPASDRSSAFRARRKPAAALLGRRAPAGTVAGGGGADAVVFPLSPDHLMVLKQFNLLRALRANRELLMEGRVGSFASCEDLPRGVLAWPASPSALPPALLPTPLQREAVHEGGADLLPEPEWRDRLILLEAEAETEAAAGGGSGGGGVVTHCPYDADDLWADTIGGLFEGFPDDEVGRRGIVVWSPAWSVEGWEMSEGFVRKWGWIFCAGAGGRRALEATNRWRRLRGEEPLVWEG